MFQRSVQASHVVIDRIQRSFCPRADILYPVICFPLSLFHLVPRHQVSLCITFACKLDSALQPICSMRKYIYWDVHRLTGLIFWRYGANTMSLECHRSAFYVDIMMHMQYGKSFFNTSGDMIIFFFCFFEFLMMNHRSTLLEQWQKCSFSVIWVNYWPVEPFCVSQR